MRLIIIVEGSSNGTVDRGGLVIIARGEVPRGAVDQLMIKID